MATSSEDSDDMSNQRQIGAARTSDVGIVVPMTPPASLGLGLCDSKRVLDPDKQADLDRDLAELVRVRREAEARSGNIRLS
jgi:hypothetical protein